VNERDLTERAQRGDSSAWEDVLRIYQQPVFRLAFLLLGDADEAEDVAQETFIHAYNALQRFDSERALRPWLLRIANNLALNRRRSIGRYLAALRRTFLPASEPTTQVHEQNSAAWEAQTLWQAVKCLPANDQQVIYLRYFLELSESETATTLQIAPGTVKSRLSRALSRLRQIVDRDFPALREERML
jgi:RNA polymerase sigma-70 factor (ECF subfamily)